MSTSFEPLAAGGPLAALHLLRLERSGAVLHVRLNRPAKRNSVSDELLAQLHTVWVNPVSYTHLDVYKRQRRPPRPSPSQRLKGAGAA